MTEQDILEMVRSCMGMLGEGVLNEIGAQDAYVRFYAKDIPQDVWNFLMRRSPNMTPFHRAIAEMIRTLTGHGAQEAMASVASDAWNKGHDAQQVLLNKAAEGYFKTVGPSDAYAFLEDFCKRQRFGEAEFLDGGLVKLYEDNEFVVTCTLSYTASKTHYGDSHWCTASGIDGQWDGYRMFCNYTYPDYILVQIISKTDRQGNSYQIQVRSRSGNIGQICDFMDNEKNILELRSGVGGRIEDILDAVRSKFNELSRLTREYRKDEESYWVDKAEKWERKMLPKLKARIEQDDVKAVLVDALKTMKGDTTLFGRFFFVDTIIRNGRHKVVKIAFTPVVPAYMEYDRCPLSDAEVNYLGRFSPLEPNSFAKFCIMDENNDVVGIYHPDMLRQFGRTMVFKNPNSSLIFVGLTGSYLDDPEIDTIWENNFDDETLYLSSSSSSVTKYKYDCWDCVAKKENVSREKLINDGYGITNI